jgi:hypothetical protein
MVAKPAPLPGDDRGRLDEDKDIPPAHPTLGKPRPQKPIGELGASPRVASLVDSKLMAQSEHLKLEGDPPAEAGADGGDESKENGLHGIAQGTPP